MTARKLANFGKTTPAPAPAAPEAKPAKAPRGSGKRVGLLVRVTPEDWVEINNFAMQQGKSMAALFIEGMQRLMESKSVRPIKNGK